MIAEFYAPTRGGDREVLQHRDGMGERWLSLQPNTPVVYEDWAGMAPGCEPARVSGFVKRIELRLLSPEPKLLVFLEPHPDVELPEAAKEALVVGSRKPWDRPLDTSPSSHWSEKPAHETKAEDPDECWGEFAMNDELKHAACRRCGWLHSYVADGPVLPRPHKKVS